MHLPLSAYLFVATALSVLFIYRAAIWIVLLVLTLSFAYIENLYYVSGRLHRRHGWVNSSKEI